MADLNNTVVQSVGRGGIVSFGADVIRLVARSTIEWTPANPEVIYGNDDRGAANVPLQGNDGRTEVSFDLKVTSGTWAQVIEPLLGRNLTSSAPKSVELALRSFERHVLGVGVGAWQEWAYGPMHFAEPPRYIEGEEFDTFRATFMGDTGVPVVYTTGTT